MSFRRCITSTMNNLVNQFADVLLHPSNRLVRGSPCAIRRMIKLHTPFASRTLMSNEDEVVEYLMYHTGGGKEEKMIFRSLEASMCYMLTGGAPRIVELKCLLCPTDSVYRGVAMYGNKFRKAVVNKLAPGSDAMDSPRMRKMIHLLEIYIHHLPTLPKPHVLFRQNKRDEQYLKILDSMKTLFNTLKECKCCDRHLENRPTSIEDIRKYPVSNNLLKRCSCSCRNTMRSLAAWYGARLYGDFCQPCPDPAEPGDSCPHGKWSSCISPYCQYLLQRGRERLCEDGSGGQETPEKVPYLECVVCGGCVYEGWDQESEKIVYPSCTCKD